VRCDDCKFYIMRTYGAANVGECRCDPPVLGNGYSGWPRVLPDDWCGKWEAMVREVNDGR
jgi:hypothetical protein